MMDAKNILMLMKKKKATVLSTSSSSNSSREEETGNGGAMVVAVRIRPLSSKEVIAGNKSCCTAINGNTIAIKKEGNASMYLKSQQGSVNEYCFDSVFDDKSSQYDVYEKTTKQFIADVVDGYNVTVFAYGATGAGKTHTMMGNARVDDSSSNSSEAGIIPNALGDVFSIICHKRATAQPGQSWNVIASFMEVYNEQVYDLLESTDKILSVREDTERGIVEVAGRTKKVVNSADDVLSLLQIGNTNRKTEATMANQVSSRSHAVLQLSVEYNYRNINGQESVTLSTLSLIDLAGSERASATNNRGSRLQEGANINKSLLALANCINALAENSASGKQLNVKYRDSKLTHLLKSSLQGKCKLVMIANINPSHITFEDSHNTLKYANRAKNIKVNPVVVSELSKESTWIEREARLKEENAQLRARIADLEATVAALQSVSAVLPQDFDLAEQDDVIDCSMDCSIINISSANVSLPVINDIPAIKSSKTPQFHNSATKKTPFSERQRKLCNDSREEFVDCVENHCSSLSTSFSTEKEIEKMMNAVNTRQRTIDAIVKKRNAVAESENLPQDKNKKVKLEPMNNSLKDRIAQLSKITLEQQKMFDNLLSDHRFVAQIDDRTGNQNNTSSNGYSENSAQPDYLAHSFESKRDDFFNDVSISVPMEEEELTVDERVLVEPESVTTKVVRPIINENPNMKVVSLIDVLVEDTHAAFSVPLIFCDEEMKESIDEDGNVTDKVPRKKRRNSLIPKKSSDTEKKALIEIPSSTENDNSVQREGQSDGGMGFVTKVLKSLPMTRASKKRMSVTGSEMPENQQPAPPVQRTQEQKDSTERKEVLRPTRSTNRRNSTSGSVATRLRNL